MIDNHAHSVFAFATDLRAPFFRAQENCPKCGVRLETYYCENRLYLVRCRVCTHVALIVADSAEQAALRYAKQYDLTEAAP